ncbi:testicular haploid expressedprotein-like [Silurus asotus]|uniref:Testicular haploid expressedprotein-like n=1 Tax=Silurus asotus TaxID=30991 RepID=A0AAD5FUH9_SILAS|nr:testicular haploid expressedprotein-like [Silurus asotus]
MASPGRRHFNFDPSPRKKHMEDKEARKRRTSFSSFTAQDEHVARLVTQNIRHRGTQVVSPPHTKQCEHSCPVWHISPATVATRISCAAKTAHASPRLEQLCVPRVRKSKLFYQLGHPESPIRPVSKGAKNATASSRVKELSIPRSYVPP